MKKYEFTGETMKFEGHTLRRIRYICSVFAEGYHIRDGSLGGWIEHEGNLSHEGDCLVLQEAKVFGNARVYENARVMQDAIVKDNVQIKDFSRILNNAIVGADTIVSGKSIIKDLAKVFFYAHALDKYDEFSSCQANISGNTRISGYAKIEATGSIKSSILRNETFSGHLTLENFIN